MYTMSNPSQRRSIMHDLYAQRLLLGKHPRIVSYKRVIESETNIFVLMELLAGKDLFVVVCQRSLTEEQARPLFLGLVEGLQHLHSKSVIHCDVKPENAMVLGDIDQGTAGTAHLKLIDFGCSCFHEFVKESETRACVVYDRYMPPELAASPSLAPSVATDMWRLGCTLYVMLVRSPPFHDDAQTRLGIEAREQGKFYQTAAYLALSDEAKAATSGSMMDEAFPDRISKNACCNGGCVGPCAYAMSLGQLLRLGNPNATNHGTAPQHSTEADAPGADVSRGLSGGHEAQQPDLSAIVAKAALRIQKHKANRFRRDGDQKGSTGGGGHRDRGGPVGCCWCPVLRV
eukprot:Skav219928  [mRNA]  locus=scaffold4801:22004:27250:- [translate_table: standard]